MGLRVVLFGLCVRPFRAVGLEEVRADSREQVS